MGYVIVTVRNLLWMLFSLTAVMALIAAIISPNWNNAPDNFYGSPYKKSPTIGLYTRCSRQVLSLNKTRWSCRRYVHNLNELPSNFWKASLVFIVFGSAISAICVFMALLAFCVQKIGKKPLIALVGVIQAIAGLFLLVGLVLWPAGWDKNNEIFVTYCYGGKIEDDNEPSAFKLGGCSLGWAFYSALAGTVLVFLCAIFSGQAEKSTSSDKVQDEIWKGKKVICLP